MGQGNTSERKINNVSGEAGQVIVSQGPDAIEAWSWIDLITSIDKGTQEFQVEHEDRNAAGALKVYSDFVWIPRFVTAGFPAAMVAKGFRNGVELGGFGIAKYPMSHPLATMATKGGADAVNWGGTYAAMSLPQKCVWTYLTQAEAILACNGMNQVIAVNGMLVDDISASASSAGGAAGNTLVDNTIAGGAVNKLAGNNLEIVRTEGAGTNTYYRRVRRVDRNLTTITFWPSLPYGLITALGVNMDIRYIRKNDGTDQTINVEYIDTGALSVSVAGVAPYVITVNIDAGITTATQIIAAIRAFGAAHALVHVENAPGHTGAGTPPAMAAASLAQFNTIIADAYTLRKFTLWGPYEWATMKYLTAMRYAVNAYPYPKGNNDYGKDTSDADAFQYYGRNDPDADPGAGHDMSKVLTGTGPLSWMHNGKPNGVWGFGGNTWQWVKVTMGGVGENYIIDTGFMGEGLVLPATNNHISGMVIVGDNGIPDLALPASVAAGADPDFDNNFYYRAVAAMAIAAVGYWGGQADMGVFALSADHIPAFRANSYGMRAVI